MIEKEQFTLGDANLASELGTLYLSGPRAEGASLGAGITSSSSGSSPHRDTSARFAPVFLVGSALDLGVAKPGYLPYGATFGVIPSTNAATLFGLPDEEATAFETWPRTRPNDGVSRSAPPSPTTT